MWEVRDIKVRENLLIVRFLYCHVRLDVGLQSLGGCKR